MTSILLFVVSAKVAYLQAQLTLIMPSYNFHSLIPDYDLKRRKAIKPNKPKIKAPPTLPPPPVLTDLSSIPDKGS